MKIAIASGKGGTGKTTLATNLAAYLAKTGNIVLADLDVEEPNSGLFMKAKMLHHEDKFKMIPDWKEERCSLCGLCQKVCNFNAIVQLGKMIMLFPEMCHSCYACSELCPDNALPMRPQKMGTLRHFVDNKLDFVEGKMDIGQEQAVPMIAQTIDYVEKVFNHEHLVIFDSPPGTSCPVIEACKDADYVILVTEPTPFGLHDLKLAVETMRELGKRFGVVVNRYGLGNEEVLQYCEAERINVIAKIFNSRKIAEIYSSGNLVFEKIPEFEQELGKVAETVKIIESEFIKGK